MMTEVPEYTMTGSLFRVTETPWFLREGSRGGWAFRGTESANAFADGGDVVYVWMKNGAAEREAARFVAYVEACITELCDAFGLEEWRKRGEPEGPI